MNNEALHYGYDSGEEGSPDSSCLTIRRGYEVLTSLYREQAFTVHALIKQHESAEHPLWKMFLGWDEANNCYRDADGNIWAKQQQPVSAEAQRLAEIIELQHQNPKLTSGRYDFQCGFLTALDELKAAMQGETQDKGE